MIYEPWIMDLFCVSDVHFLNKLRHSDRKMHRLAGDGKYWYIYFNSFKSVVPGPFFKEISCKMIFNRI
jgi:hypothetical protein